MNNAANTDSNTNLDIAGIKKLVEEWINHAVLATGDYWDCGEVNFTLLAENAASQFDLYENDLNRTIPEWVFDLAIEVGVEIQLHNSR